MNKLLVVTVGIMLCHGDVNFRQSEQLISSYQILNLQYIVTNIDSVGSVFICISCLMCVVTISQHHALDIYILSPRPAHTVTLYL